MTYELLSTYFLGAFLALAMAFSSRFMPARLEQRYWTIIIAVVVLGFPPFPMAKGDMAGFWFELAACGVFLAFLVASRWVPAMLAVLSFSHGLWDLMHLLEVVAIDKPTWLTQFCVPYDWIVSAYLFSRLGVWREARSPED